MSARIVERLKKELSPQLLGYLSKTAGEAPTATAKAADTAITTLLSGIAATAATTSGLTSVSRIVNDPVNDGTLLDQLPALYQGTMTAAPVYRLGSQMLHQVFGSKLGTVNQSIATLSSVKPSSAATLTSTIAPHVLAVLGQEQRASGDLSAAGLARLLGLQAGAAGGSIRTAAGTVVAAGSAMAASSGDGSAAATAANKPNAPMAAKPITVQKDDDVEKAVLPASAATRDATAMVGSRARSTGSGAWLIFPLGLAMGAGLLGVGTLIREQTQGRSERPAASVPTTATTTAAAPAAPAPAPADAKPTEPPATTAAAVPPVPTPGTTSFYGSTPTPSLGEAKLNPDYKTEANVAPPARAIVVPESTPRPSPPGTTTYFGSSVTPSDLPVVVNPDYKPTPSDPATPPAPPAAGTTTFFGSTPTPPDLPVVANPDYKPALRAAAADQPAAPPPAPSAKPATAAKPPAPPPAIPPAAVATPSGTTTFFGTGPGTPPLPPVALNPDYKPAVRRDNQAKSSPATPPPTLDLAGCRSAVAAAVTEPVRFETARAALTSASTGLLDKVAAAFKTCAAGKLKIEGHTDDRGSAEYNLRLSEARARSVAAYLAGRGVDKARLGSEGFGFAKPVVPNSSPENMARNRRIEFVVE